MSHLDKYIMVYDFCLFSDNWFEGTPIPTPRGDFAIGMLGGRVVCAGGLGEFAILKYSFRAICEKVVLAKHPLLLDKSEASTRMHSL